MLGRDPPLRHVPQASTRSNRQAMLGHAQAQRMQPPRPKHKGRLVCDLADGVLFRRTPRQPLLRMTLWISGLCEISRPLDGAPECWTPAHSGQAQSNPPENWLMLRRIRRSSPQLGRSRDDVRRFQSNLAHNRPKWMRATWRWNPKRWLSPRLRRIRYSRPDQRVALLSAVVMPDVFLHHKTARPSHEGLGGSTSKVLALASMYALMHRSVRMDVCLDVHVYPRTCVCPHTRRCA